ncbi:MAG: SDR family oxidoreductase [Anaerolineaceae bacterium]|nr:SDR family oxidoreductase [Anaerolineaceae bacterium]
MSARFPGQVALITGVCDGLCLSLARAFMQEGAQVALAGSDGRGGAAAEAIAVRWYALDLRDHEASRAVIRNVVDQLGGIDVWLHHASPPEGASAAAGLDDIGNCAQVVGENMKSRGTGRVIFLATVAGLFAPAGQAQRNSQEAGLYMLTKSLAVDWAPPGLRVNAIARGVLLDAANPPDDHLLGRIPLGRAALAQEIVEAALFLADDRESSFVTGEVLRVDGGWTAYHLFHPFDEAF